MYILEKNGLKTDHYLIILSTSKVPVGRKKFQIVLCKECLSMFEKHLSSRVSCLCVHYSMIIFMTATTYMYIVATSTFCKNLTAEKGIKFLQQYDLLFVADYEVSEIHVPCLTF